jgi:ribosomal protein S18 acetylase RimI-like enzyme
VTGKSVTELVLSPLEHALLECIYSHNKRWGIPPPHEYNVVSRENTGCGRFTYLAHSTRVAFDGSGDVGAGDNIHFEMSGLPAGGMFHVYVKDGHVLYLEIITYKDWDGKESDWVIPEPGPRIRRGAAADLEKIVAIQRAAYARNRDLLGVEPLPLLADYHAVLSDPAKDVWLLQKLLDDEDRLIGVLILERRADDLLIESIATDPDGQGQGYGNTLLNMAHSQAIAHSYGRIRLYTGSPLTHLIAWYGRHGFTVERIEALPDRSITHMIKAL